MMVTIATILKPTLIDDSKEEHVIILYMKETLLVLEDIGEGETVVVLRIEVTKK